MKHYSIILFLILSITVCGSSKITRYNPDAKNYQPTVNVLNPEFSVFHVSDSISELNFKINTKQLLYTRPDGINFFANVLISFRLVPSFDSKEFLDSASVRLTDLNNEGIEKYLIGKLNIRMKTMRNHFLRVTLTDLNRNTEVTQVLFVQKDNGLNRQNYLVRLKKEIASPLFDNRIRLGDSVSITYKSNLSVRVFVRYYQRDFGLALPPFSDAESKPLDFEADSIFSIEMVNGQFDFVTQQKGFYHFQLDTSSHDGLTLFVFSNTFPDVKKVEDLVPPLRYITSKDEFTSLLNADNKKAMVDKFWLSCGGSQSRSRDLISKYYNRVESANTNFTSYLEGWKTDRGMIFLILGQPNVIYRSSNRETWIYGEENNINSLTYIFSRVSNPFTDNDYQLERSYVFKQTWYAGVDMWRQGKAYLQD